MRCLEGRCDSLERFFFLAVGCKSFLAGDCQDTASSRSDTLFFDNLENADFRSITHVSSSAKLDRVVTDGYDANFFTIFFAKERHGTHSLSRVNICLYCLYSKGFPDFLIDFLLDSAQLFCCHRLEMRKVKAQEFYFVQRACLCCMVTKNIMQGSMQEVGCRVVFHHAMAAAVVNFQFIALTQSQRSQNFYSMQWLTIWRFLHILNLRYQIACSIKDLTVVSYLTTHFCIEWCFCKDESSCSCLNRLY